MNPVTRTPREALEWFHQTGTPVAAWARQHGFAPAVVYALLNGRTRGHRGTAHQVAVALGLKPGTVGIIAPDTPSASSGARSPFTS